MMAVMFWVLVMTSQNPYTRGPVTMMATNGTQEECKTAAAGINKIDPKMKAHCEPLFGRIDQPTPGSK